ncbi:MAG TPA: PPOX class F420-dependent oxidoreductase [Acidimicrobiales bacterium]|nr:PPOX class F420-dependent oxidoreductase [Acidimicrobiales bacterium]
MTDDEVLAFLTSDPPHTGTLATVRSDGRPHVAPIWFAVDTAGAGGGVGDVVFNTGKDTVKGRTLRRDPRASLCVDDETPPYSFVTVEGTVTISEDLDELRRWATIIGGRYMGADRAEELGERNGVAGELVVRLHPSHIVSAADLAE